MCSESHVALATTPPESNTSATSAQAGIGSLEGRVSAPKEGVCK